jgi:hypothetical protein
MRAIRFPLLAVLVVCSIAACSANNAMNGRGGNTTPLDGETPATTSDPECSPGEVFFMGECRPQRGIIIDQGKRGIMMDQRPNALGIIIDQKKPPQPPPPPPPPPPRPN